MHGFILIRKMGIREFIGVICLVLVVFLGGFFVGFAITLPFGSTQIMTLALGIVGLFIGLYSGRSDAARIHSEGSRDWR